MLDIYTRSPEEIRAGMEEQLKASYPSLIFKEFLWVNNPTTHLAIDDISLRSKDRDVTPMVTEFQKLCTGVAGSIEVLPLEHLTAPVTELLTRVVNFSDPSRVLLMYPGDGGESVKAGIPERVRSNFPEVTVRAKRVKDPATREVTGIDVTGINTTMQEVLAENSGIGRVIVVDDVIDSGKTLMAIREGVSAQLRWSAATPIMFSPLPYLERDKAPSSLPGFDEIFASVVLQGRKNPVDLNSLSSFLEEGVKGDRLREKCLKITPLDNQDHLFRTLTQLKEAVNI